MICVIDLFWMKVKTQCNTFKKFVQSIIPIYLCTFFTQTLYFVELKPGFWINMHWFKKRSRLQTFMVQVFFSNAQLFLLLPLKWRILSQTTTEQSGKNKKFWFFLLDLKYTLRTCFESKNFLPKSCPELSNQVLSFSACQI